MIGGFWIANPTVNDPLKFKPMSAQLARWCRIRIHARVSCTQSLCKLQHKTHIMSLTSNLSSAAAAASSPQASTVQGEVVTPANKCQYKTGKCMKPRAVKRSGQLHSLCEEHRMKQNLIQRRSDRKYQSLHAQRRRQKTQQKALLRKQLSLAMAQDMFFRHQMGSYMSSPPTMRPSPLLPAPLASPPSVGELWLPSPSPLPPAQSLPQDQPSSPASESSSSSDFSVDTFFSQSDSDATMEDIPVWDEPELNWRPEDLDALQDMLQTAY